MCVTHRVALVQIDPLRRAVKALFGLDHLLGGEAVFAASVFAEFDQIGCIADGCHHRVELLHSVAVAMRELRNVFSGEGRLLMRDGIERHGWIGNDARAIVARDLAMQFGAICFTIAGSKATALDALGWRTNLRLRLQGNALRFQTAMIDAGVYVEFGQALIGKFRPSLAPALDQFGAVPVANL